MSQVSNIGLRSIAKLEIEVVPPVVLGELNGTERRFVSIKGGSVNGPLFSGTILPGGSDIQLVRANGTIELVARYALDLGPFGTVLVENTGIRRMVDAADVNGHAYFRGVMRFEAPRATLGWLNDTVFISTGYRDGSIVYLEVFEVL
ncbi:DUF3237 family protein [Noviherbaspirillum sp. Root189]|uniref:DUF3237 family protein n=1 Tax=Noviherbaspirillum sp. Root189 TaxID=1736487 RepID=UPI00070D52D2|nr:DUF3237 family protein [Noviherbaspirillum sp. Root189]KRB70473.1 hypothetical protein ASE07_07615 [Noviherbaspirillum sp. Root189]